MNKTTGVYRYSSTILVLRIPLYTSPSAIRLNPPESKVVRSVKRSDVRSRQHLVDLVAQRILLMNPLQQGWRQSPFGPPIFLDGLQCSGIVPLVPIALHTQNVRVILCDVVVIVPRRHVVTTVNWGGKDCVAADEQARKSSL